MRLIEHTPKKWAEIVRARSPITDSIVPISSGGVKKLWNVMSDKWLLCYTQRFMKDNGITRKKELHRAESGLYQALLKRGILDELEFEKKQDLDSMGDEELVEYAKQLIKEKGIRLKSKFEKSNWRLGVLLRDRGLLNKLGFAERRVNWESMDEGEIINYAKRFIEKNGIGMRSELGKSSGGYGLYEALRNRGLLDSVGFDEQKKDWAAMSDKEIVEFAKKFVEENGVSGKGELRDVPEGHRLYAVLLKRGLLEEVGFEAKRTDWAAMGDGELVKFAKIFMEENGVSGRRELQKVKGGSSLYNVLWNRNLLDSVGFEAKKKWAAMSDEELVIHARRFIEENEISGRGKLDKAKGGSGLYKALSKRNLLEQAFSKIESLKENEGLTELSDAMDEFGGEECD